MADEAKPMTEAEIADLRARWTPAEPRRWVHVAMDRHRESPPWCWRVGSSTAIVDGACDECGWRDTTVPTVEQDVHALLATVDAQRKALEEIDTQSRAIKAAHTRWYLAGASAVQLMPEVDGHAEAIHECCRRALATKAPR